jgi:hypothetical protein
MHLPRIERGASAWEAEILPLNYRCRAKKYDIIISILIPGSASRNYRTGALSPPLLVASVLSSLLLSKRYNRHTSKPCPVVLEGGGLWVGAMSKCQMIHKAFYGLVQKSMVHDSFG